MPDPDPCTEQSSASNIQTVSQHVSFVLLKYLVFGDNGYTGTSDEDASLDVEEGSRKIFLLQILQN